MIFYVTQKICNKITRKIIFKQTLGAVFKSHRNDQKKKNQNISENKRNHRNIEWFGMEKTFEDCRIVRLKKNL